MYLWFPSSSSYCWGCGAEIVTWIESVFSWKAASVNARLFSIAEVDSTLFSPFVPPTAFVFPSTRSRKSRSPQIDFPALLLPPPHGLRSTPHEQPDKCGQVLVCPPAITSLCTYTGELLTSMSPPYNPSS